MLSRMKSWSPKSSYRKPASRPFKSPRRSNPSRVDSFVSSGSGATGKPKSNLSKMLRYGAIGAAVGAATLGLLMPGVGIVALVLAGGTAAIAGAAIGDGALETAGTKPSDFDPYKFDDLMNFDNFQRPDHPYHHVLYGKR